MICEFLHRSIRIGGLALIMSIAAVPFTARGAIINVILGDLDVTYRGDVAGGALFDVTGHPGGNLNPAEADRVAAAVFELEMLPVGTTVSAPGDSMYGDLRIDGLGSTIALDTLHTGIGSNGGGFGLDWFTDAGHRLRLGIDSVNVVLTSDVLFFTGQATILDQNMPFELIFDASQPVVFSYTATLPDVNVVPGAPVSDRVTASGALTISGTLIPEPATGILLLAGIALAVSRRRRRGGC